MLRLLLAPVARRGTCVVQPTYPPSACLTVTTPFPRNRGFHCSRWRLERRIGRRAIVARARTTRFTGRRDAWLASAQAESPRQGATVRLRGETTDGHFWCGASAGPLWRPRSRFDAVGEQPHGRYGVASYSLAGALRLAWASGSLRVGGSDQSLAKKPPARTAPDPRSICPRDGATPAS
jgi:hypothetical protein